MFPTTATKNGILILGFGGLAFLDHMFQAERLIRVLVPLLGRVVFIGFIKKCKIFHSYRYLRFYEPKH